MLIQQKIHAIRYAEELPNSTLLVIGLWNMGYTEIEDVARLLWIVDLKPLRKLYRILKTCHDPLIQRYINHGLPRGVCRMLPGRPGVTGGDPTEETWTVRCSLCGSTVNCVPCVFCSLKNPMIEDVPRRRNFDSRHIPESRTTARPGSDWKIEVMRERIAKGESAFSSRDRRISRRGDE